MSKKTKVVEQMVDYVHQLRRHTEGRRAVHIRLSALEKPYREEHYRLYCAGALRSLITRFGGMIFSLPNTDLVMITRDAAVDNIDPQLTLIRRKLKGSSIVASLDPAQGVSDTFVEWFDLETQYADFRAYIDKLAAFLEEEGEAPEPVAVPRKLVVPQEAADPFADLPPELAGDGTVNLLAQIKRQILDNDVAPVSRPAPNRKIRFVQIKAPQQEVEQKELDPELLITVFKALYGTDVTGLLRRQRVMAILGDEEPMEVFVHKQVPRPLLFKKLFKSEVVVPNRWLSGYLDDYVTTRILRSLPSMEAEKSLASSIRVTASGVMSEAFDAFDKSLGARPRSRVILELTGLDMMANPHLYMAAVRKATAKGYRLSLADLDPLSFVWLDENHLTSAFVKVRKPEAAESEWLTPDLEATISSKVDRIGMARAIFDGCDKAGDVALGTRLGFTLFQGEAVDPLVAV